MVTPNVIRDRLRETPFRPFTIRLVNGHDYEITHPDRAWVTTSTVEVGLEPDDDGVFSGIARCPLMDISELVDSPPEVIPQCLFRFRSFESGKHRGAGKRDYQELFEHGRLYFSSPKHFNDPYDCFPSDSRSYQDHVVRQTVADCQRLLGAKWQGTEPARELREIANEEYRQRLLEQRRNGPEALRVHQKTFGSILSVLCLVEHVTSNVMWAHYADHHQGFAVELNVESDPFGPFRHGLKSVKYGKSRPEYAGGIWEWDHFYWKAEEWNYEREWRIVTTKSKTSDGLNLASGAIKGVFLGWDFPPPNRRRSLEILSILSQFSDRNPNVPFFKMVPSEASFDMKPELIHVGPYGINYHGDRPRNEAIGILQPALAHPLVKRVLNRLSDRSGPPKAGSAS